MEENRVLIAILKEIKQEVFSNHLMRKLSNLI